ncbi:MazG family protein [Propionibacterium acidifaciens]|uniref:MazG family protein n=1 Tax=Propionibacterium acidifaciens TaxID=556499 RepID=UPI0028EE873E|nr:MazG family protein [Propionibacterium acidifaciens]
MAAGERADRGDTGARGAQLERLVRVVDRLRADCPWDAAQTHRTLVKHLIEESAELVDAIEVGSDDDLREELGDVLMQVVLHARIAEEDGLFTIDDVAAATADKLIARHPHVFAGEGVPGDLDTAWELRKRAVKHRDSCLDGIAGSLPTLARAAKTAQRLDNGGPDGVPFAAEPITSVEAGVRVLRLVQRAQASGVDIDQAVRDATRAWEDEIRAAEEP